MVFGVHRHPGADPLRFRADGVGVLQRDLLAVTGQRLTQRRQLQRHLQRPHRVDGLVAGAEPVEQRKVCIHGGVRRVDVGDILAEVVDRDQPPRMPQLLNGIQRIGGGFAGHEAVHHLAGDRQSLGRTPQPVRSAGGQDGRAHHTLK